MSNNLGYEKLKELDNIEIIVIIDNEVDLLSSSNVNIGNITSKLIYDFISWYTDNKYDFNSICV